MAERNEIAARLRLAGNRRRRFEKSAVSATPETTRENARRRPASESRGRPDRVSPRRESRPTGKDQRAQLRRDRFEGRQLALSSRSPARSIQIQIHSGEFIGGYRTKPKAVRITRRI